MGIVSGGMTVRRYRLSGAVPDDFRDRYREALQKYAFRDSNDPTHGKERMGWVEIQNLLDTSFEDWNRWLFDRYLVVSLRVDKKVVPPKYFKAHLQKREEAWCLENGRQRCPAAVRTEIKERLEFEMLARALPRVQVTEMCWNVVDGWVIFHSLSEKLNDNFRKLFMQTFGLGIYPVVPLDLLGEDLQEEAAILLHTAGSTITRREDA